VGEKFWDRHDVNDRVQFAKFLEPLVIASRTKNFTTAEASVYLLTLQDVPREVLALGVTNLIEAGITWMPKPGDIKQACCAVVDERRALAARSAKALQDDCPDCRGSGWRDAEGPNAVEKCSCVKRALELLQSVGEPLKRLSLPSHEGSGHEDA
jgi:hypothetical protein